MLPILEGGRRVCPWSSGLHKLWQRLVNLEVESLNLCLTLAPLPLPQLFNKHTTSILSGKLVASYLVSVAFLSLGLAELLPLRSGRLR